MFSNVTISFIIAISTAAWIYTKLMRSTGNNTKSSLIGAGVAGLVIFIIVLSIANSLLN